MSGAAVTHDTEDHSHAHTHARTECTGVQTDGAAEYPSAHCGSSYRGLTDQAGTRVHRPNAQMYRRTARIQMHALTAHTQTGGEAANQRTAD